MGPVALKYCNQSIQKVLTKLGTLEGKIQKCLEELVEDELLWDATKEYKQNDKVKELQFFKASSSNTNTNPLFINDKWEISDNIGNPEEWNTSKQYSYGQKVKITTFSTSNSTNINKIPHSNPIDWLPTTELDAKNQITSKLTAEIDFELAGGTGLNSNPSDNLIQEQELLNTLSSPPGLSYKEWYMTIETDSSNTYAFPRRRILATRNTPPLKPKPLLNNLNEVVSSNIELVASATQTIANDYSYSSSVEVLINEMKFRIDNFNSNINLSLTPPLPPPPSEKEMVRDTNVLMIKLTTWDDAWEGTQMPTLWANEIFDLGWDYYLSTQSKPEDHWLKVKAANEGYTLLEACIRSLNWQFQSGRMNLKSFIQTIYGANEEQATKLQADAIVLGRMGNKTFPTYNPTNYQYQHVVKKAIQSRRYIKDSYSPGPNLERQALHELAWIMKNNGEISPNPWPNFNGFGPKWSGEDSSNVKLAIGRNASGKIFEVLGGYIDDGDLKDEGYGDQGAFSLPPYINANGIGSQEQLPRITRHFKAYDYDYDILPNGKWFEVPNPNVPWL